MHSTRESNRPTHLPACSLLVLSLVICGGCCCSEVGTKQAVLRLATTTSTRDSGLLDRLLPPFEEQHNVRVDVIAAGTGKALKLGEMGDVDVVLVHAPEAEEAFMAAGHGSRREVLMHNTFELVGPADDPAEVRNLEITSALQKLAEHRSAFVSRGDDSGTHKRELQLWQAAGGRPDWPGYKESGQGMGATLTMAHELSAYTLTDRGTYLFFHDSLELEPLAKQSEAMHNPYGVMTVNPEKHPTIQKDLANSLVDYLISPAAQTLIAEYQLFGEQLFTPLRLPEPVQP